MLLDNKDAIHGIEIETLNIANALSYGRQELQSSDSPDVDTQVLLCHVLDCQTVYLHSWSDQELSMAQQQQFEGYLQLRNNGRPVAHIIGQRGFWSLDLKVTDATLIPRPDTELLVELALAKIQPTMTVVDLGTGTGAIALSLAVEHTDTTIFASDYSEGALAVAQHNARANQLSNVHFIQASWLTACQDECFDMVVSNPPYIEDDDPHLLAGDVRFEPLSALASGADGLDDIRLIVEQAHRCLRADGWLLVEHGYHQAKQVRDLFTGAGFNHVSSHQDFGGNDRVVMGQLTL